MEEEFDKKTFGSPAKKLAGSDIPPVIRDAIMVLIAAAVTYIGNTYVEEFLASEINAAIVTVVYTIIKMGWKWITDTRRMSPI